MLTSFILTLALGTSAGSDPCRASCYCAIPSSAGTTPVTLSRYHRKRSHVVILGTVVVVDTTMRDSVAYPHRDGATQRYLVYPTSVRYTLRVERSWKGPRLSEVVVTDYFPSSACAGPYAKGQAYLVYAQKDQRVLGATGLTTTLCSRVLFSRDAAADRQALGPGRSPSS